MRSNIKNNFDDENQMTSALQSREDILLKSLLKFYKNEPRYLHILSSVSKQKTIISLREMDYTVTNYSFNNKVVYPLKSGEMFNMSLDYKNQLRGYSKKCLDPFCRRQRIFLDFENMNPVFLKNENISEHKQRDDGIVTTIGQLNFFRWAITNEVIDYCFKNKENIDKEMEKIDKEKKTNKNEPVKNNESFDDIKVVIKFD